MFVEIYTQKNFNSSTMKIKKKFFFPQGDKNSSPQKEVKYEPFSFADGK